MAAGFYTYFIPFRASVNVNISFATVRIATPNFALNDLQIDDGKNKIDITKTPNEVT